MSDIDLEKVRVIHSNQIMLDDKIIVCPAYGNDIRAVTFGDFLDAVENAIEARIKE